MKALTRKHKRINFIPPELRPSLLSARATVVLILLFLSAIPIASLVAREVRVSMEQKLAQANQVQLELSNQITNRVQSREASDEKRAASSVQKALAEKIFWADVFKELSNLAPKSIWLTAFETSVDGEGKKVLIAGQGASQTEIAELFSRLERSYFFRFVQLKFTQISELGNADGFRFQFEGRVYDAEKGVPNGTT